MALKVMTLQEMHETVMAKQGRKFPCRKAFPLAQSRWRVACGLERRTSCHRPDGARRHRCRVQARHGGLIMILVGIAAALIFLALTTDL